MLAKIGGAFWMVQFFGCWASETVSGYVKEAYAEITFKWARNSADEQQAKKYLGWVRQELARTLKTEDAQASEGRLTAIENKLPNLVDVPHQVGQPRTTSPSWGSQTSDASRCMARIPEACPCCRGEGSQGPGGLGDRVRMAGGANG